MTDGSPPPTLPSRTPAPRGLINHVDLDRDYYVYAPTDRGASRPLVVYLHGCNQTAPDVAVGTRWNEVAEVDDFVVAYPEQSEVANGSRCWNWFVPENQTRGSGEAEVLLQITRRVMADYDIDPRRVYVIGASAGANMAGIMAIAYPDVYAAVGQVAGCPYIACTDITGELAYRAMGDSARPMPAFIAHGTADPVVPYAAGEATVTEWLGVADRADDGTTNRSVPLRPATTEQHAFPAELEPGQGDPCVPNGDRPDLPCLAGVAGTDTYPHTIRRYNDAADNLIIEFLTIHGAGHAWVGGNPDGSFVDPAGPNLASIAYGFLMRHSLPAAPPP